MRRSNVALRLPPHLLAEAKRVATGEGIALSQLISSAVAEKLSALRTAEMFAQRGARADIDAALAILARAGEGNPPEPGDDIPDRREDS